MKAVFLATFLNVARVFLIEQTCGFTLFFTAQNKRLFQLLSDHYGYKH